jgi:hypothetical protein
VNRRLSSARYLEFYTPLWLLAETVQNGLMCSVN